MRTIKGLSVLLLLSACSPALTGGDTVRICSSGGCHEQARNLQTFHPSAEADAAAATSDPDSYEGEPVAQLVDAASGGDAVAHYKLGLVHRYGLAGLPRNAGRAAEEYEAAAELGHAGASLRLAEMLSDGDGIPADRPRAVNLMLDAARGGQPLAAHNVALMFADGDGLPPDPARAAALFEQAAKAGVAASAYNLGLMYMRGQGVRMDTYKGLVWLREAATLGDVDAQVAVGRIYMTGLETMDSDPAEAGKWLAAAAGQGSEEAGTLLEEVRKMPSGPTSRGDQRDLHRLFLSRPWRSYLWPRAYHYRLP